MFWGKNAHKLAAIKISAAACKKKTFVTFTFHEKIVINADVGVDVDAAVYFNFKMKRKTFCKLTITRAAATA